MKGMQAPKLWKEVLAPGPRRVALVCVGAITTAALVAVAIAVSNARSAEPAAPAPTVHIEKLAIAIGSPPPSVAEPEVRPARQELAFVFEVAGSAYMAIADADPEALGAPHMITAEDPGAMAAAAEVDVAALPAAVRAWQGRTVVVDGTCKARVVGFMAIGRVFAQWSLLGEDGKPARGDALARMIFEGGPVIIAAKLDACTGSFARDAALPAIAMPPAIARDRAATARALAELRDLPEVKKAQRAWRDAGNAGHWLRDPFAIIEQRAFRHPTTGAPMVSVHAQAEVGCGGVGINLWALFRIRDDTLERVSVRDLGTIGSIEHVFDLDKDGDLEIIARDNGTDLVLLSSGTELLRLYHPFVGCRC